jgi:small-conductance mechanosensitive channel
MIEQLRGHPWLYTFVAALLAALLALALHHFARAVLRRIVQRERMQILSAMLERTQRSAGFAAPLFAMQLVWASAPGTLEGIGSVRHVNAVLLIAAFTSFVMGLIGGIADGLIAKNPVDVEDNLHARRVETQTRVLSRSAQVLVLIGGASMILMTFPSMRQLGASLLASAGVLGIIGGLAARPVFSNLISGLQIALSQPIRLDDVLIVNGEWGRVEEITGTYVVLKIWDERRLIIPLQWFIENPFENWTRSSAQVHGTVEIWADYGMPLEPLRGEFMRLCEGDPAWDRRTASLAVTDASERSMKVRALVSSADSGSNFDLRCRIREGLIAFMRREFPEYLPHLRTEPVPRAANDPAMEESRQSR